MGEYYKCSDEDSLLAEVVAIEMAAVIASRYGWKKLCFYSDSKVTIGYINGIQQIVLFKIFAPLTKIREMITAFESIFSLAINQAQSH